MELEEVVGVEEEAGGGMIGKVEVVSNRHCRLLENRSRLIPYLVRKLLQLNVGVLKGGRGEEGHKEI